MNVPATWQTAASVRMYRDELERLGRFLVRLGGSPPSPNRLIEVMEDYDARRAALRGLVGTLSAWQASEAVARFDLDPYEESMDPVQAGATGGLPASAERYERTSRPWHPDSAAPAIPLALIGGPLMLGDGRLFEAIERAGGQVVLDGTEGGVRTMPAPLNRRRLRDDPLMELVDAYFGSIPDVFRRPDSALTQWLGREVPASGARGIIVWRYVWCDLWAAAVGRLRESTGLPVLDMDISGDDAGFDRTAHRLAAFLEVLR
jgi:hypothetical protein